MVHKSKIKIAVLESDTLFRELLSLLLRKQQDFEMLGDFDEIHSLFETLKTKVVDILFMDSKMHHIDGKEILLHLKKHYPDTKVIVLTTEADEKSIREFIRAGANAYLIKNVQPRTIIKTVYAVIENKIYYTGIVAKALLNGSKESEFKETFEKRNLLSPREIQILHLLVKRKSENEIASELSISIHTVHTHHKRIYLKTVTHSISELISYALKNRMINPDELL